MLGWHEKLKQQDLTEQDEALFITRISNSLEEHRDLHSQGMVRQRFPLLEILRVLANHSKVVTDTQVRARTTSSRVFHARPSTRPV